MGSGEERAIIVSIVIITKDTRELLEGCLRSVEKDSSLVSLGIETIIIDNASNDGTDSMVRERFPDVIYIRNDTNAGFAAAVNRAGRAARGKYMLFLNSDTLLIEGEAAKMISYAQSIDNLGILGPQLVYDDLSHQRSTARIPGLMQELIPGFRRVKSNYLPKHEAADVESLIGAAVLIRKKAFDDVNGFDERFFFFLEETDFCVRLLSTGHRVVFYPAARVVHLQRKTVRQTSIKEQMEYTISLRKFIRKHHSPLYAVIFDSVKFTKALMFVVYVPFALFGKNSRQRYLYYCTLIDWYFSGCPDNYGLREK